MKGVKKCFLFLFTLMAVSAVSCLVIFSEDTYALKHQIESMPLYNYIYYDSSDSASTGDFGYNFDFEITQTGMPGSDGIPYSNAPTWFGSTTNRFDINCVWHGDGSGSAHGQNQSGNLYYNSNTGVISTHPFNIYSQANTGLTWPNPSLCMQSSGFNSGTARPMDWITIPPLLQEKFRPLSPYFYDYASYFYLQSTSIDGVHYDSHGLRLSDILDSSNNPEGNHFNTNHLVSPTKISIPIGNLHDITDNSDFINVRQNSSIEFSYEINLSDPIYNLGDLNFYEQPFENAVVKLEYIGLKEVSDSDGVHGGGLYRDNISCPTTVTYWDFDGNPKTDFSSDYISASLSFTCHFVSDYDIYKNLISFRFLISPGESYSSIWQISPPIDAQFDVSFYRYSLYVVTDYDNSPGSSIGGLANGGDLSKAPGSVLNQYANSNAEANWFSSLTNLFGFSFINPFSPLFTMFTDSSTCANIPIIAGMLNSSNTQYCSWFSADTRNILTPVLSISAMMLVFGFAVRWLSSSSGNMFEDQTTHKASNTQPKGGK